MKKSKEPAARESVSLTGGIFKAGPCVLLAGAEGTASVCEEELEAHKAGRATQGPRSSSAAAPSLSAVRPTLRAGARHENGLCSLTDPIQGGLGQSQAALARLPMSCGVVAVPLAGPQFPSIKEPHKCRKPHARAANQGYYKPKHSSEIGAGADRPWGARTPQRTVAGKLTNETQRGGAGRKEPSLFCPWSGSGYLPRGFSPMWGHQPETRGREHTPRKK